MENNSIKLKKIESDQYKIITKSFDEKVQAKLDLKSLKNILWWIVKELKDKKLYDESWSVYWDYEQINFAMNKVYTYIYDSKNCNLWQEDIKIFISYLVWKIKNLKDIVDKIEKK